MTLLNYSLLACTYKWIELLKWAKVDWPNEENEVIKFCISLIVSCTSHFFKNPNLLLLSFSPVSLLLLLSLIANASLDPPISHSSPINSSSWLNSILLPATIEGPKQIQIDVVEFLLLQLSTPQVYFITFVFWILNLFLE